jgi:hypothetical protein
MFDFWVYEIEKENENSYMIELYFANLKGKFAAPYWIQKQKVKKVGNLIYIDWRTARNIENVFKGNLFKNKIEYKQSIGKM